MKKVLIGLVSDDPTESISIITKSFIRGLKGRYDFIPLVANRKVTTNKRSSVNLFNVYYYVKHLALWVYNILRYSPEIAHYPITSFWNMEKSLTYLFIAHVFGIKTIGHLHGGAFVEFWSTLSPVRKKTALYIFGKLDALVVLSPAWKEKVCGITGINPEKVHVVSNPMDSDFEKVALDNSYNTENKDILCLGVMDTQKGVFDILEAARSLDEASGVKFILAGPEREPGIYKRIDDYIKKFNLQEKVVVMPGVWGDDKIALFKSASVLLLPSYIENFPVVVIEAAAFGMPLLTTRVGALPEYFVDKASIIYIEPASPRQLFDAVTFLHTNDEQRLALGAEARRVYLDKLSTSKSFETLSFVYDSLN